MDVVVGLITRFIKLIPVLILCALLYQIVASIYCVFFHPLRKFPGPVICRVSSLPLVHNSLKGDQIFWLTALHEKYGEIVRYSPNELSFSSGDAWKDIYGHKKAGQPTLIKNPRFYHAPVAKESDRVWDIITGNNADHSRFRRIFSNAFSDRALKIQEPLFVEYVDRLVNKISAVIKEDPEHKFNMVNMYNFTTFDVMGDLAFGEPLNLLQSTEYHSWLKAMFSNFRFGVYLHCIRYFAFLEQILLKLLPILDPSMVEKQKEHHDFTKQRVDRRLAKKEARPDIWGLVLEKDEKLGMTRPEMDANANLFMIAGTETTATLLSGLTYYLLANPDKLKILTDEIRSAFKSTDEITIERLQALKYLQACVEEGLRVYPPVSNGLQRIVPAEGTTIDDVYVPGGCSVSVTQFAAYRNPKNFRDPYEFIPERWISDDYASDKKHALQPFSVGPRNCLGKNMAYHEIRLILAKVLYEFDLKLCRESQSWNEQKVYIMWDKPDLVCQLAPVQR